MALTMDELVANFIRLREKKSQLKAEYEAEVAKFEAVQDKIEALLLQRFGEMGVESVKTPNGTAYISRRTSVTMGDWDSFRNFCMSQEDPYMYLDRRPSKAAVEQYKQANADLPPGVNYSETKTVNFRRS